MLSQAMQAFRPSHQQRMEGPASPKWATQSKGRAGLMTLISVRVRSNA